MKIVKTVFIIILFVLEGLMSLVMTSLAVEAHAAGALGSELAAVVIFCGFAIVSLAELLRMMLGREHIILPMFGMKAAVFTLGMSVGMFADYSATMDKNAIGAGVTLVLLTVAFLLVGIAIKYSAEQKKSLKEIEAANGIEEIMFSRFSAEWYYDDVAEEYFKQNPSMAVINDTDVLSDEANDQIYIYACNRIAYLFVWLLKRNGLSSEFLAEYDQDADELNALKNGQGNPSEFIYNYMDGKLCKDDVEDAHLIFLHNYYERFGYRGSVRAASYAKDYDEIVLDSRTGSHDILYCFDFSWEKYHLFEKRLDERFENYLREASGEDMKKLERTIYSETFGQELDIFIEEPIFAEPFADVKKQAYDIYIEDCLKHVAAFPSAVIDAICEKLKSEWGVTWGGGTGRDEFLSQIGAMDISIYKPYGEEIAYVLGFEADFEQEHGVAVCIWNNKILSIDYRLDACSPWTAEMDRYKESL